jgi:hypothetical protein
MARKVNFKYSNANLSLDEIDKTYRNIISSLDVKYSKSKNRDYESCFMGYAGEEVLQEKARIYDEIDKETCLTLFASVEATLRTDFINRCQLRKRDNLSKYYRKDYNPMRNVYLYSLKDVVFKGWIDYIPSKEPLIKTVKDAFGFRNWLAHGRYWSLDQSLSRYDYSTLFNLLKLFVTEIEPYIIETPIEE